MSDFADVQESDESKPTVNLEDLDVARHLGCSQIDISSRTTAYGYDDEPDHITLTDANGNRATLTRDEAAAICNDLERALEALKEEEARRYFDE
jgi:hypothetical protein